MEESGFNDGELDDIIFMRLKPKESIARYKMKLQIAVADLHQRMMDDVRKYNPSFVECDCDKPVLDPSMLYLVDCERRWKEIDEMPIEEVRKRLFDKVDVYYQKSMIDTEFADEMKADGVKG